MRARLQPWQLSALLIVLCAAALGLIRWHYTSRHMDAAGLVQCLPPDQATHVYIDVGVLRNAGILDLVAGSKAAEEPDYRQFVDQTGFDYRSDMDAVAAAFMHGDLYLVIRGRFDWKKLTAYARAQGGDCRNTICEMPASAPGRHISFYPLRSEVLALAVSNEQRAVYMIAPNQWKTRPELPADPVWISAPSFAFSDVSALPDGTHSFLGPLAQARKTTFSVGPDGQQLRVRADVQCETADAAASLARQLTASTELLKKMLERDHMTPNPRDLSAVLIGGKFDQQDKRVTASWPMDRGFVEAISSGNAQ